MNAKRKYEYQEGSEAKEHFEANSSVLSHFASEFLISRHSF